MAEFSSIFPSEEQKAQNTAEVRAKYGKLSSAVGILTNIFLSVLKLFVGLMTASMAITADAINNISDAGASIISLISFKMSEKPADREHPFGHARIEYVASMIVSFLILHIGIDLLIDSFKGIINPEDAAEISFSYGSLIILCASIVMKLCLSLFQNKIGRKIDSSVIRASAQDSLFDCISTTAVLISSIIIKFTNLVIIDSIMGLAVSILIIVAGLRILNDTKNALLGEAPIDEILESIKKIVAQTPEIIGTHDLMVHNYGPHHYIASFHAEVDGNQDIYILHDTIDNVEKMINSQLGILCTIHLDPITTNDETVAALLEIAKEAAKGIDEKLKIHDFRAVIGNTHTNLIFDIELPFESKESPKSIVEKIQSRVSAIRSDLFCVITVDRC